MITAMQKEILLKSCREVIGKTQSGEFCTGVECAECPLQCTYNERCGRLEIQDVITKIETEIGNTPIRERKQYTDAQACRMAEKLEEISNILEDE